MVLILRNQGCSNVVSHLCKTNLIRSNLQAMIQKKMCCGKSASKYLIKVKKNVCVLCFSSASNFAAWQQHPPIKYIHIFMNSSTSCSARNRCQMSSSLWKSGTLLRRHRKCFNNLITAGLMDTWVLIKNIIYLLSILLANVKTN